MLPSPNKAQIARDAAKLEREPLVILPGLLCDSRMFAAQMEHIKAVVIDGFYGGADTIDAMATYALDRMPGRSAVVGHSMGARVALAIWQRAPERVTRLALADTGIHDVQPGEAMKRYALLEIGRTQGDEALVDNWLPPMVAPARRHDPILMTLLKDMSLAAGTEIFARQISAMLRRPAAYPILSTIDCPAVVIVGAEDEWSPIAQHETIVAAIPGARLHIIPAAGHMAPAEASEQFNGILRDWLSW